MTNTKETPTKLEQLETRMEELTKIIQQKQDDFLNGPDDHGDEESMYRFMSCAEREQKEYEKLSRQYRVLVDASLENWDGNGDMMFLETFVSYCKGGGFIDDDGFGNYSDGTHVYDVEIYPSDVTVGNYRKDFTHIIWYNK